MKPADNTMKPGKGDAVSVRSIPQTQSDRKRQIEEFREDKAHKEKIKEERFAKIQERRKNRPPRGGNGGGINIEVTSDGQGSKS